jgi:hypothetical protein
MHTHVITLFLALCARRFGLQREQHRYRCAGSALEIQSNSVGDEVAGDETHAYAVGRWFSSSESGLIHLL